MDPTTLITRYPRLYHMATAGSWPSIQQFGLRTTEQIVETAHLELPEKSSILTERRPKSVRITHPELGKVTVRDQVPLRMDNLRLLDGTPEQWLETLNNRVFFWLHPLKLQQLLSAKLYRDAEQDVITVDTQSLLQSHGDRVRLSPYNSGATLYPGAPARGSSTFVRIDEYDWNGWRKRRSEKDAIVELAVIGGVQDLAQHALLVERRKGSELLETLWIRPA